MRKLFSSVLAAALLVSLFSVNALAAGGYGAQTVTDYSGTKYTFSSATVEKKDLTIDWVEGETVQEENVTVITMEPGSTLTLEGSAFVYWDCYQRSAATGNCSILYDGTAGEYDGNRSYTTDQLFAHSAYWEADVVMVSFTETFDSQSGGKAAYIVLGDGAAQPEPEQPEQVFSDVAPDAWYAGYTDAGSIADYAGSGVELCYRLGIMSGGSDGTFHPLATATRAEVAVTMAQMARVMGR